MRETLGLSLYILHIVERSSGQIKVTYPSFSLGSLIEVAERKVREFIRSETDSLQACELYTNHNIYAQIIRIDMDNPETEHNIWLYEFNKGSLSDSIQNISSFKDTNESNIRSAIYIALGRNLDVVADLVMDTLQSTLQIPSAIGTKKVKGV